MLFAHFTIIRSCVGGYVLTANVILHEINAEKILCIFEEDVLFILAPDMFGNILLLQFALLFEPLSA